MSLLCVHRVQTACKRWISACGRVTQQLQHIVGSSRQWCERNHPAAISWSTDLQPLCSSSFLLQPHTARAYPSTPHRRWYWKGGDVVDAGYLISSDSSHRATLTVVLCSEAYLPRVPRPRERLDQPVLRCRNQIQNSGDHWTLVLNIMIT